MALEWVQKGNLRGPSGPQGIAGQDGKDGKTGASYRTTDVDLQANATVQLSAIHPSTNVQVGDLLCDPQGDVFPVASLGEGTVQVGTATGQNLRGPQGVQGPAGEDGKDGTGVNILGSVDDAGSLPGSGQPGDAYLVGDDAILYVWDDGSKTWVSTGKGITGPQGPKGEAGEAATVTVGTTQTGEAGSQAQVNNSGSSGAAVLNFVIPKGDKGDTGAAGPGVSVGSGAPSGEGQPGECYIDVATGNLYTFENAQ